MGELTWKWASERAILLSAGGSLGEAARASVLIAGQLQAERPAGLFEIVPGAGNVLVILREGLRNPSRIASGIVRSARRGLESGSAPARGTLHRIPVEYGGPFGPDLPEVAKLARLSTREVVDLHSSTVFVVAFIGFSPGFPYLLGLPSVLQLPRLASPRTSVPAGSVAVAGPFAGIYPRDSPGGWRLLGRTSVSLFDPERKPPALLATGDTVRFDPS